MADDARAVRVGVIGLGRMGSVIASHLGERHDVTGWDVRSVTVPGVRAAASAADLAATCDVILSCLPTPQATAEVVLEDAFMAAFREGNVVFVDASTSDPDSVRRLAAEAGEAADRIVDAPILGRPDRVGAWTIPMGGADDAIQRAAPVLSDLAARVEPVGPLGAGHALKLLNNMMFGAINVITAEAIGACDRVGVDPRRFVELVAGSQAATVSPLFRDLAPRMLGDDDATVFTTALLQKDVSLAVGMCTGAGVPLRLAPHVADVVGTAVETGLGDEDTAALVRLYTEG